MARAKCACKLASGLISRRLFAACLIAGPQVVAGWTGCYRMTFNPRHERRARQLHSTRCGAVSSTSAAPIGAAIAPLQLRGTAAVGTLDVDLLCALQPRRTDDVGAIHYPVGCGRIECDLLRNNARCTACGHKGATLSHPGWGGTHVGFLPFPVSPSRRRGDQ